MPAAPGMSRFISVTILTTGREAILRSPLACKAVIRMIFGKLRSERKATDSLAV